MKAEITVTDNEAIMSTPMGGNVYSNSLIITKEAFIECYEKWVKPRVDEPLNYHIENDGTYDGGA